jgi:hypothetical protein
VVSQDFYGRDVANPVHLTVDTLMNNNQMAIEVRSLPSVARWRESRLWREPRERCGPCRMAQAVSGSI